MFTKSYVEKCKQKEIQEEIKNLVFDSRRKVFIKGDTFYHPDMDKDYEVVTSIPGINGEHIYGEDNMIEYLAEECFLIPTHEELLDIIIKKGK